MGCLLRFKFSDELVEQYPCFVETGVGAGVSLGYAAEHKFSRLSSIEYDERLINVTRPIFGSDSRVRIVQGNSGSTLGPHIESYPNGTGFVFWLDAHWPGSDYFGDPYVVKDDQEDVALPLMAEFQAIADTWDVHNGQFVIIVDDVSTMMMLDQGASYLFRFCGTHDTHIWMKDEGYAVITPKGSGSKPELIEQYDIFQLVSASRRYIEHGHWSGARGFVGAIMGLTEKIDDTDRKVFSAKRVARGEACRFMAAEAMSRHNVGAASDLFIQAMIADPLCIEYRMDYIYHALLPINFTELALHEARVATKMFPDNPRAWCSLVEVHRRLGNREEAAVAMSTAQQCPRIGMTDLLAAQLAADLGEFDESVRLYKKVIDEHPDRHGEALLGWGVAIARDGRFEESIALFDEALEVGTPDDALCRWNRAENLLSLGRYAEGWLDHGRRFDLAMKIPGVGAANTRFSKPRWEVDTSPCRVLVQSEQGFGDAICMARYVPILRDLGHHVQFEVDPKLVDLFLQSPQFDGVKIIPRAVDYPGSIGIEDFDVNMPSMCFPAAFGTTTDNCQWTDPYLQAQRGTWDDLRPNQMRQKLKVGFCWRSGRRDGIWEDEYYQRKSLVWDDAKQIIESFGNAIDWHLFDFPVDRQKPDLPGPSFAETADILSTCDLLIACDTGIAHLGGAMGMPVWVLRHGPAASWHWMAAEAEGGRWVTKSPWYPSVTIFRQRKAHAWSEVISQVIAELRGYSPK
jgi:hypothetical protein